MLTEINLNTAAKKYRVDARAIEAACRRRDWEDPFAVDEVKGELIIFDDHRLKNFVKSQNDFWDRFFAQAKRLVMS